MYASARFISEFARSQRQLHAFICSVVWNLAEADDVLQEAFLEAGKRLGAFRGDDKPFLVWIRLITQQTMIDLHRKHLGAKMRSAGREVLVEVALDGIDPDERGVDERAALSEEAVGVHEEVGGPVFDVVEERVAP
jgi:DNA-directed RNA polymerase specialized sigma24 family protein